MPLGETPFPLVAQTPLSSRERRSRRSAWVRAGPPLWRPTVCVDHLSGQTFPDGVLTPGNQTTLARLFVLALEQELPVHQSLLIPLNQALI